VERWQSGLTQAVLQEHRFVGSADGGGSNPPLSATRSLGASFFEMREVLPAGIILSMHQWKRSNCVPARSSNCDVRWVLSSSLTLLPVLWLLVGCGAPQEEQKEHQQEVIRPIEGEFVGEVPQLDAFLALVALEPQESEEGEREVRGYLSDGRQLNQWFTTTVSGDSFQVSADSGIKLYADLDRWLTIGTIVLASGERFDFQIPQASGIDGVYPLFVPPERGELSSTSWNEAQLEGTRGDGEEIIGTITPPDIEEEALGSGFSVAASEEGDDRWIVVTADDGQPRIKGAKIVGD
jgi:hypothetical protein